MSSKKKTYNSFSDFVFSTNPEYQQGQENKEDEKLKQTLEVHIEKKHRAGKPAVLVKGYRGHPQGLKDIARKLKSKLATGGTIKNNVILIQGDIRDKVMAELSAMGYGVKRVGG